MAIRRRGPARPRSPADRCVAVAARFAIYRQFGRRPSQVYVDDTMHPATSGPPERRLADNVFWRTSAAVGDLIEERAGGMSLLAAGDLCYPIQLSAPRPLEIATAFGHADAVLREDREILDGLLADGSVVEVTAHRSRAASSRLPEIILAEDHPLVVAVRPHGLDAVPPLVPGAGVSSAAPDKSLPAPR